MLFVTCIIFETCKEMSLGTVKQRSIQLATTGQYIVLANSRPWWYSLTNYVQIRKLNKQNFDHLSHLKNYKPWYTALCDKLARFQEHVLEAIWSKKCLIIYRSIWLHYWVRQALTFTMLCDSAVIRDVCLCSKLTLLNINMLHLLK
jgi:hypothetical protein